MLDVTGSGHERYGTPEALTAAGSTLPIIFITGHADVRMAVEAMERGAFGFLEKPFRLQELCEKIQSAVRLDVETWRRREEQEIAAARLAQLTPAERKVADRVITGKTNKMIAQELGLSTRTVEAHRARLMQRLGIRSRTELVRLMAAVAPFSGCGDEHSFPISRNQDTARRAEHVGSYLRARHGDRCRIRISRSGWYRLEKRRSNWRLMRRVIFGSNPT